MSDNIYEIDERMLAFLEKGPNLMEVQPTNVGKPIAFECYWRRVRPEGIRYQCYYFEGAVWTDFPRFSFSEYAPNIEEARKQAMGKLGLDSVEPSHSLQIREAEEQTVPYEFCLVPE